MIILQIYDEIPDTSLLTKAMEHYLKEYNTLSKAPMPLVMFRLATEHTSRYWIILLHFNSQINNYVPTKQPALVKHKP